MKKLFFVTLLFVQICHNSFAYKQNKELPSGYFMVVAAYASTAESYAIKFVQALNQKDIDAKYGFSTSKDLFFVYTAHYNSIDDAIKSIDAERERTGENRAWVYAYNSELLNKEVINKNPSTQNADKEKILTKEVEESEKKQEEEKPVLNEVEINSASPTDSTNTEDVEKNEIPISHQGITYLYIEAIDATTGKPIKIDYEVIDLSRNILMANAISQESFALTEPNSVSKMIQVQSNNISWQKQSFDFKYYEPIIDPMSIFLDNLGDTTFVNFEMVPLKKGDLVTLYKVFFYKDAAIMMEKSNYELDQVVSLLENNPSLNIIIHGHTNGSSAGKVIALKNHDDVDFFNINGDHRELAGSAQKLSYERANIVGRYLESQGIATSRLEIKGWGGKKMIYDKHSPKARYNVRVEIEVVDK